MHVRPSASLSASMHTDKRTQVDSARSSLAMVARPPSSTRLNFSDRANELALVVTIIVSLSIYLAEMKLSFSG